MNISTHVTTPFGRRPVTLAQVAAQAAARDRAPEAAAHKWTVFRNLCAARARFGLSERSLAVLDALLSFHPETVLTGERLVVFPSNAQLSLRAHGMAPATLRRHLGALVEAGVILRRDSPNGKRYARRGRDGEIDHAFGFDLAPLVARAGEFEAAAEAIRAEAQALRYARERITLARRDLVKLIAAGVEAPDDAGRVTDWEDFRARFRVLVGRLGPRLSLGDAQDLAQSLSDLAEEALKALERQANQHKMDANESHDERHIQSSDPEPLIDLEPAFEKAAAPEIRPQRRGEALPLGLVLQACPDIADYARGGISNWRDLNAAAAVARAALRVSPSAWEAAKAVMGEMPAAIVIAALLQRGEAIASAGGYLRALTEKAEAGGFSVGPLLMALIGAHNREKRRA